MKKFALIAAAALMAAGVAQAQTKGAAQSFYVEGGYVFMKAKVDLLDPVRGFVTGKGNPTAFRGIVGMDVHPNVAVELMLAGGGSDDNLDGYLNTVEVKSSYGVFVKPKYALDDKFEVFGRIGYAKSKGEMRSPAQIITVEESDLSWGLGASYKFSKQWYGSVDYMSYFSKNGVKVDGFAVNAGYRF